MSSDAQALLSELPDLAYMLSEVTLGLCIVFFAERAVLLTDSCYAAT
jgi:hypothetical protein